jgi:hypothetical protein
MSVATKTATFSEVKPYDPAEVPARLHGVTSKKALSFSNSIDCPVLGILLSKWQTKKLHIIIYNAAKVRGRFSEIVTAIYNKFVTAIYNKTLLFFHDSTTTVVLGPHIV